MKRGHDAESCPLLSSRSQFRVGALASLLSLLIGIGFAQSAPAPDTILTLARTARLISGFTSNGLIQADFSPDGRRLVFNGRRREDKCDALYLVNRDGSRPVRLFAGDSPVFHPAFAPDGSAICFNAGPSIYEYRIASDSNRLVAGDAIENEGAPAYTADGRRLLYCSQAGIRAIPRHPDPGRGTVVPVTSDSVDRDPACSPDSLTVAFAGRDTSGNAGIFLATLEALGRRSAVAGKAVLAHPDWSPDRRWLLYDRAAGSKSRIWVVSLRTGRAMPLTHDSASADCAAAFAPDGRSIVFTRVTAQGQEIWVGELASLTKDPRSEKPETVLAAKSETASVVPNSAPVERARYKIVIFASDAEQAREFLARLSAAGYDNPDNYVSSPPTGRPVVKHNNAPDRVVHELIALAGQYLDRKLSPELEPRLSESTIYVNLP